MFEKIEKPVSLDEKAYLNIKDAILKCALQPGEPLAEIRLAEDLGISKTPVRNALARLQQEGFLVNVPYKGHFVTEVSVQDIAEIYELRQILECYVIRQTAGQFSSKEFNAIEENVEAAQQALSEGNIARYVVLNREFHHSFDRKYGHQRISDVLTNLDEHVQRIIFYTLKNEYYDILDKQRNDHRLILDTLKMGDVDSAVQKMKNHLAEFCNALIARMRPK